MYSYKCYIELIDRYETRKEKEAIDKSINSPMPLIIDLLYRH